MKITIANNIVELPLIDEPTVLTLYDDPTRKKAVSFDKFKSIVSIVELIDRDTKKSLDHCSVIIDGRTYTVNLPYEKAYKLVFC